MVYVCMSAYLFVWMDVHTILQSRAMFNLCDLEGLMTRASGTTGI